MCNLWILFGENSSEAKWVSGSEEGEKDEEAAAVALAVVASSSVCECWSSGESAALEEIWLLFIRLRREGSELGVGERSGSCVRTIVAALFWMG